MSERRKWSRREFLKMVGATASATALEACTPTPTEVATTPTPEAAPEEIEPIVPEMVLVEAGNFQMGSTNGGADEQPVHIVHITRPLYIAKYAVTFEEYDRFCDDTIGIRRPRDSWGRATRPVSGVNWYDAVKYCNWLSEKEGLTPCYNVKGKLTECDFSADGYRLPTEAEWEYAARGGHKSQGYEYAGSNSVDDVGWYEGNSGGQTHPVGQKQPNELGLYDMSGNMWEWCWDWYGQDYYASSPASDPTGPSSGTGVYIADADRARRGGSYREKAVYLRRLIAVIARFVL
jgi:formylglycine-generating enzyme required for sulfatase activity